MILIAKMRSAIGEEEHTAPTVEPTVVPLKVMIQDSPREVLIDGAPMEMEPEMSIEGCSKKDLVEVPRMEKMVDNPEKDLTMMMETGGSLEMMTPAGYFLASTAHTGPSDLTPRAPSTVESLQSAMEYLRNLLSPVERLFLNE